MLVSSIFKSPSKRFLDQLLFHPWGLLPQLGLKGCSILFCHFLLSAWYVVSENNSFTRISMVILFVWCLQLCCPFYVSFSFWFVLEFSWYFLYLIYGDVILLFQYFCYWLWFLLLPFFCFFDVPPNLVERSIDVHVILYFAVLLPLISVSRHSSSGFSRLYLLLLSLSLLFLPIIINIFYEDLFTLCLFPI